MIYSIQTQVLEHLNGTSQLLKDFSLKLTGNKVDANDLYQDTALRIITNADKYNPGTNFKAWSITIMRNLFINGYRKKVRRNLFHDRTSNNFFLSHGEHATNNEGESSLAYEEVMKLVDKLPPDFKVAFVLRCIDGYKYDEIADELGVPIGTVKSRIFFAKKKLQKMIKALERH
ncbi:MAG: RNA polymerase sigma factor [Bacteroidota bacterium]